MAERLWCGRAPDRSCNPALSAVTTRSSFARTLWTIAGLAAVLIGGIGVVIPGLPTTVFFIIAAWAFSKSNPRLEAWVLGLPTIGPMVQDHRDGLGMPARAKVLAIGMIVVFAGLSVWTVDRLVIKAAIGSVALIGIGYIALHIPTKKRVGTAS